MLRLHVRAIVPMFFLSFLALLTAGIAAAQGTPRLTSQQIMADDQREAWSTTGGDARHDSYVPIRLEPATFEVRWVRDITDVGVEPRVAAALGRVYVSGALRFGDARRLIALDAQTGDDLWNQDFTGFQTVGGPATAYGLVYVQIARPFVGQGLPTLRAYDGETGALVFSTFRNHTGGVDFPPTLRNGVAYLSDWTNLPAVSAIDAFTGSPIWVRNLPRPKAWTPAVDDQFVYVFVEPTLQSLRVYSRFAGTQVDAIPPVPNVEDRARVVASPVLSEGGMVFAIDAEGDLVAFDLAARQVAWVYPGGMSSAPAASATEVVIVAGRDLIVLDASDGSERWRWRPDGSDRLRGTPILTEDHVFVSTSQGGTYAVDLRAQQQVWSIPVGGHLAFAEETLYINHGDRLVAISTPEYIPSVPVGLEVEVPAEVAENSTTSLAAMVTYSDGQRFDRTALTTWSMDETRSVEISDQGELSVGEILLPVVPIRVIARYSEAGTTLEATASLIARASIPTEDLLKRNLEQARALRTAVDGQLFEAHEREKAVEVTLDEIRRGDREGPPSKSLARRARDFLRKLFFPAKMSRAFNEKSLEHIDATLTELEAGEGEDPSTK